VAVGRSLYAHALTRTRTRTLARARSARAHRHAETRACARCRSLLEALCRHRCAWPFVEEEARLCPAYLACVPRPTDLGTALARLRAGAYANPQARENALREGKNVCAGCKLQANRFPFVTPPPRHGFSDHPRLCLPPPPKVKIQ
jgi:hypothetical protein